MRKEYSPFILILAVFVAISGLLFGFDTGTLTGAILFIKKQFNLSLHQHQFVVAVALLGGVVGALISGYFADTYGRKKVLIAALFLFIIGALTTASAYLLPKLIVGRLLTGFAIGTFFVTAPTYVSEIAPPKSRGFMVTTIQLFVTVGILAAFIANYFIANFDQGWRYMFSIAALIAIIQAVALFFFPESPRFLVLSKKSRKALKVLQKTHDKKSAETELAKIKKVITRKKVHIKELFSPKFRLAFIIALLLNIFQQITGINAIIYYAPTLFQMSGFSNTTTALLATMGLGIVNFLMTLVAIFLVDKVGRKPILDTGLALMAFAMFGMGVSFYFHTIPSIHILLFIFTLLFVGAFALSMGPMTWLISSEILPTSMRGKAMSLVTAANWGFNFLVSCTFLTLAHSMGSTAVFVIFGFISIIGLLFFHKAVPETKNKVLEEIKTPKIHL